MLSTFGWLCLLSFAGVRRRDRPCLEGYPGPAGSGDAEHGAFGVLPRGAFIAVPCRPVLYGTPRKLLPLPPSVVSNHGKLAGSPVSICF